MKRKFVRVIQQESTAVENGKEEEEEERHRNIRTCGSVIKKSSYLFSSKISEKIPFILYRKIISLPSDVVVEDITHIFVSMRFAIFIRGSKFVRLRDEGGVVDVTEISDALWVWHIKSISASND